MRASFLPEIYLSIYLSICGKRQRGASPSKERRQSEQGRAGQRGHATAPRCVSAGSLRLAARGRWIPPLLVRPCVPCRLRACVWCRRQHVRQRVQGPSVGCGYVQRRRVHQQGCNVCADVSARDDADADAEADACADTYANGDTDAGADADADAGADVNAALARRMRVGTWCPRGLQRYGRPRRRALPQRRPRCRLRQPVLAARRASAGELH
jgi:hypothetical protein